MNRLRFQEGAVSDLEEGRRFYEGFEPGAGDYFLNTILSEITTLETRAGFHRRIHGFHKLNSRRFPYSIYYLISGGQVTISAILDMRKNPPDTRRTLTSRNESTPNPQDHP